MSLNQQYADKEEENDVDVQSEEDKENYFPPFTYDEVTKLYNILDTITANVNPEASDLAKALVTAAEECKAMITQRGQISENKEQSGNQEPPTQ